VQRCRHVLLRPKFALCTTFCFSGHPDIMNKVFMGTRGGFAKSSKVINVSEDVFAGFTAALRGGESKHIEYMQMGKGRDIGMLQISLFEAKVSGGSTQSMTTRDAARIDHNLEFIRGLSLGASTAPTYSRPPCRWSMACLASSRSIH